MASTPTAEEWKALQAKLEAIIEHVKDNREEAIRVLLDAGIVTEDGKLAPPYAPTQDD